MPFDPYEYTPENIRNRLTERQKLVVRNAIFDHGQPEKLSDPKKLVASLRLTAEAIRYTVEYSDGPVGIPGPLGGIKGVSDAEMGQLAQRASKCLDFFLEGKYEHRPRNFEEVLIEKMMHATEVDRYATLIERMEKK